jgi:hypothetical protein
MQFALALPKINGRWQGSKARVEGKGRRQGSKARVDGKGPALCRLSGRCDGRAGGEVGSRSPPIPSYQAQRGQARGQPGSIVRRPIRRDCLALGRLGCGTDQEDVAQRGRGGREGRRAPQCTWAPYFQELRGRPDFAPTRANLSLLRLDVPAPRPLPAASSTRSREVERERER